MATIEQTREAARRRKANERARAKGRPEPYPTTPIMDEAEKSTRARKHEEDLAWAIEQDMSGGFYKSECRAAVKLLDIFEGKKLGVLDPEDEDEDEKNPPPNPSITAIRIRSAEFPPEKAYRDLMEVNGLVSFQQWLELRDKARKDLFWLCRLLGLGFYRETHQIMCDMFVKKNFDGLYFPEFNRDDVHDMIEKQQRFTADGTPTRTAMLFAPRSSYKSTADGVDAVQWLLNCPDIRVLIMASVLSLSSLFMVEIKKYFYLAPRGEQKAFHLLFPEYILTGRDGTSKSPMLCPARNFESKEPHLWVTSLDSSFVGQRCDIRKIDDAVEDKNSADDDLREALKNKIISTGALVEPWGFTDIIGTRYFTVDWYGWRMGQTAESEDDLNTETEPFMYTCLAAWYPKPGFEVQYKRLLDTPGGIFQVTEDMVDLFFPKKLSFKHLRTKLKEYKERGFKNQYLNIATDPQEVTDTVIHFERPVLRAHTYSAAAAPKTGEKLVTIDWAYSDHRGSDYSVLAATLRHTRDDGTQELVVLDLSYDKWKSSDLVRNIVLFLKKHNPSRTLLEAALGIELLMMALRAEASRQGCLEVLNSIRLIPVDNSKDAKTNRIKTLEILLDADRLYFVAGTWIDELYRQFERFTGDIKMGRKDDIPDCISLASRTLPQEMFTAVKMSTEEADMEAELQLKELRKQAHYHTYFGTQYSGTRMHPAPPNQPAPTWREKALGVRQSEPVKIEETAPAKPQDPRMRIFGNKGPWRL